MPLGNESLSTITQSHEKQDGRKQEEPRAVIYLRIPEKLHTVSIHKHC